NPPSNRNASGRMRGSRPSALGELEIELARVSRHANATRGELVEVLSLPVQEAVLLEVPHVGRDVGEGEPQALGQRVARVQVRRVRGRVVDFAILEEDSSLQVHRQSPQATSPRRARAGLYTRREKWPPRRRPRGAPGGARR